MMLVLLYGHLGRRFGRVHRYEVRSPAEAVRALCATLEGFRADLAAHSRPGYRVLVGGREARELETLGLPADGTIRIVPVTAGAGRGVGAIILGAALIMAGGAGGFIANSLVMGTSMGVVTAGAVGVLASKIGVSLVLGGISQMLAPQPKTPGTPERPENKPSYVFDGPVNTAAQGNPVPVCYGRLIVGSQVISAGMAAEEYAP